MSKPSISPSDSTAPVVKRARARLDSWRLRRRRARQAKKKAPGRRMTIALGAVVVALLCGFGWTLKYLSPTPPGIRLSLDELTALANENRLHSVTFLDEDNRLVGQWVKDPVITTQDPDADKPTSDEGSGRTTRDSAKDAGASGGSTSESGNRSGQGEARKPGQGKDNAPAKDRALDVPPEPELESIAPPGSGRFWVAYPKTGAAFGVLLDLATRAGARVEIDPQARKQVVRAVGTYLLPLLILASVFGLLFATGKSGGSGIGEVMTFGSMNKKRYRKGGTAATTFADVGSAQEAITELKEVVDYLKNPARYEEIGAVPPKGVLLFGPPGCGKTLLAKAVAGEAGVPFFSVAGAEFVESLVGVGAARVRDLFQRVRAVAPAIVFIDELDAAGRRRGHGGGEGGSDEREQTLNQMLVEMDGFEVSAGMVVMGATNRPDILDPALLRPGRFDRHITVEQPDHSGRRDILMLHARGKPIAATVDFDYIARRTPGFSGADLANVINEGALLSIRVEKPEIETPELEEAIQRVLHGPKKRGQLLTPEEEQRAATHEAGHAIVAAALGRAEAVHRVSILARSRGIGSTGILRDEGAVLLTSRQLYSRVVIEMGGVAAEQLVLGDTSTGAEQDLEKATELARDMIARYGMSPKLGRVRLMASDADQYLGGETAFGQLSVGTQEDLDSEMRRLLAVAEAEAVGLLTANRGVLDDLARTLELDETLEGSELASVLGGVKPVNLGSLAPFSPPKEATEVSANGRASVAVAREM